jgi:hypothetical protein
MNEEIKEQTITCPVCKTQLKASAKFCSECGTRQAAMSLEPTWVAAMHERIDHAKDNDLFYTLFAVLGALTAIVIPFVMRFILRFNLDVWSWSLTIVGVLFFLGGYAGILYDEKRLKDLIRQLEAGGEEQEENEEEQSE